MRQTLHVLTLVVRRHRDIPLVRSKAKILSDFLGFSRIMRVKAALMASEVARFMLRHTNGGRVVFFAACKEEGSERGNERAGILMRFQGDTAADTEPETRPDQGLPALLAKVRAASSFVQAGIGQGTQGFELEALILGGSKDCTGLMEGQEQIRRQLFRDLQESYIENLRAKHQEVLSLLRTLSLKNKELDRVNSELVELSKDMESLVHERTVVEFALRIADRVRNPATVIGGLARMLLKRLPEDFPHRDKMEAIYLEAQKLEAIVRDFEGLAREQERFFTELVLQDLVEEILAAWQPNLRKKGIVLRLHSPDRPVKVKGNPRTLKVAILHVLKNAVDASPVGGILEVAVSWKDGRPVVEIADQGPGIEPEVKARLFKELVTTKPSGTGVGLIMVHHIMKEHQGRIEIDSAPGRGTTVRLIFPSRWHERDE